MAEWNGQKPVTQWIGIALIVADHEFQSRAAMSVSDQKEFSEAMERSGVYEFPAIVVFEVKPGVFMLADGFHRHGAAKALMLKYPEFQNIKCDVYQGTIEDVRVYSAGANQKFSIKRTMDDIKKAVWMLLDIDSWRTKSSKTIGTHVGCSTGSIRKWRTEYFVFKEIPEPAAFETSDGKFMAARRPRNERPTIYVNPRTECRSATVFGKRISLGTSDEEANAKLDQLKDEIQKGNAKKLGSTFNTISWLCHKGLHFKSVGRNAGGNIHFHGIFGYDCFVVPEKMDFPEQAIMAFGRVILLRQHCGGVGRMVVLCYRENRPEKIVELAKLAGVEFMTPEELVVSLGGKAEPVEGDEAA